MSKKHLQEAVENPDEQIRKSSDNLLGRVFWTLVPQLGITDASINASMNKYIRDPNNVPEQTAHKRSEKMSNLTAELTNPRALSWNKFIEGLKAIEVFRVRVRFEVWRGRREVHAMTVLDLSLKHHVAVNDDIVDEGDDHGHAANQSDDDKQ